MNLNNLMTKVYKIFLPSALIILLNSCQPKEAKLRFHGFGNSAEVHLFGNDNFPAISADLKILVPTDSLAYHGLYQVMASTYFDSLYDEHKSCDENLQNISQLFIVNYQSLEQELNPDSIEIGSSYNWEIIKNNKIVYHGKQYISFMNEQYAFTGGAHGNTMRDYYTYDLKNQKLLTSGAIFISDSCSAIIELQKRSLTKAGIDLGNLWDDGFKCDNFYLLNKGIVFHYNQYEIASYAAGPMDVFVSFKEIQPYLKNTELLKEQNK